MSKKWWVSVTSAALVAVFVGAFAVGTSPALALTDVTCNGTLVVTTEVWNSYDSLYRLNGSGPGLPSEPIAVMANVTTPLTFELPGPATWPEIILERSNEFTGGEWLESGYPISVSCMEYVAGCDVLMNIPAGSVVGTFLSDAPTYWRPGQPTLPLVTIPAGNTAWVIGQDATGDYYKIVWVCDYLWVDKDTLGPNYDNLWQGAPLPAAQADE